MFICSKCGAMFDEPAGEQICFEVENGVSSMFENQTYRTVSICPECGSYDIEEFFCDEVCEDCPFWKTCTLDERKGWIYEYDD